MTRPRRRLPRIAYVVHGKDGLHPGSAHVRIVRRARKALRDGDAWVIQLDVDEFIKRGAQGDFDAVLVQRDAVEPILAYPFLKALRRTKTRLVLDLDDDLLTEPAVDRLLAQGYDHVRLETLKRFVRQADSILVSTEPLAASVRAFNRSVVLVPNVVDPELWTRPRPAAEVAPRGREIRAVYMGSWTHGGDLDLLRPVFESLVDHEAPVALETIGVAERNARWFERLDIPAGRGNYPEFVPWLLDNRHRWDVAVAPLESTEFNAQKSDLKFLEYTMLGLPTIASAFGPYAPHASNGITLASTTDEWKSALWDVARNREAVDSARAVATRYVESERLLADSRGWIRAIVGRER
ncbi:hypothetical protein MN032_10020 [Agromyces atrinae]|uniref:hypothetical protein n=1 Tax=Agromyces atrinae TaxID=592376 RepID=UPI001F571614|nr:hypothetical protein [Agromyces atrinae]MCI2958030.1 hypothetical protein [Agromyces atrinae]